MKKAIIASAMCAVCLLSGCGELTEKEGSVITVSSDSGKSANFSESIFKAYSALSESSERENLEENSEQSKESSEQESIKEVFGQNAASFGQETFTEHSVQEESTYSDIPQCNKEDIEEISVEELISVSEPLYINDSEEEPISDAVTDTDEITVIDETPDLTAGAAIPEESYTENILNDYQTLNYNEVKGIWISYLELSEMESGSEEAFRGSIGKVYDNCVSLGINTVFVHVRSHADAYYNSECFPKTKYIDGEFDALSIMIEEAHNRELSFHGWINPLRACAVSDIERERGYVVYDWAGEGTRLVKVGDYYYLNPAYDDVIKLITKGVSEIVSGYDVDGIHIDDYFYPTTEEWFDRTAFQNSDYELLSDFRFANCDNMVRSIYSAVKEANPNALFGISCQGSLENNYNQMYADVKKWCSDFGYTDYIMPQIYYGFDNSAQPFEKCAAAWDGIAESGRIPLIIGLSVSKIGREDEWAGEGKYEWIENSDILKRQFETAWELPSYGGICLYSYRSVFSPSLDVEEQVNAEIKGLKSAIDNTENY